MTTISLAKTIFIILLVNFCQSFSPKDSVSRKIITHQSIQRSSKMSATRGETHVETILFVECGFGADAHGQDPTKAAIRACRNAIEFNQIPSIADIVPGGRDGMKLDVLLAVPNKYQQDLDLELVRPIFPYGNVKFQIQDGGMIAQSGKKIESLGDKNEDMVVVCAAVTVGY